MTPYTISTLIGVGLFLFAAGGYAGQWMERRRSRGIIDALSSTGAVGVFSAEAKRGDYWCTDESAVATATVITGPDANGDTWVSVGAFGADDLCDECGQEMP